MFKELVAFSLGMLAGFVISSYNKETKEVIELIIKKGKIYYEDLKKLVYQSLKSIEDLDSDLIKLNYEKIVTILKSKLNEITELSSISDQIEYATSEISGLFERSKLKLVKNTIDNTKKKIRKVK
ncbi:MAG: hypothetical protein HPPSJP_0680 [Candidatus Hepatoplasma scabrum]|nr:MAG: hypothetical protein HPPSJP_0680 [Candidatus Hepatoplasma sp.]